MTSKKKKKASSESRYGCAGWARVRDSERPERVTGYDLGCRHVAGCRVHLPQRRVAPPRSRRDRGHDAYRRVINVGATERDDDLRAKIWLRYS